LLSTKCLSERNISGENNSGGSACEKNKTNISTSSSDDDRPKMKSQHQKPPATNQKQRFNAIQKQRSSNMNTTQIQQNTLDNSDARRKKLVKRSKCSIINVKGIITHTPTDDDITNILKEFTVDFLLKGFDNLVHDLHEKLVKDPYIGLDISHFSWLVTYFLKFAAELELDLDHIRSVLTFDVISYLTYEGVHVCEQLEITSRQEGTDLTPYLRRSHLVVAAIREFLQALEMYKRCSHLSIDDKERIFTLQLQISSTEDLRHLFVLLLRCYNPKIQSIGYLQDLIVTNHILLLLLDDTSKCLQQVLTKAHNYNFKLNDHMQQFATVDIMNHYGTLLENFQDNGEYVNDCIFTMIHHGKRKIFPTIFSNFTTLFYHKNHVKTIVGGDINHAEFLFQPIFLKTFSRILETEFEVCDDWSDLIEYVINKFVNTPLKKPEFALLSPNNEIISISDVWAQEEMETLYWYYMQSKNQEDVVGNIIKQIKESGQQNKSRIAVIQQLLQQDIIQVSEYDELMKFEDVRNDEDKSKNDSGIVNAECSDSTSSGNQQDDVKVNLILYYLLSNNLILPPSDF
jgi:timeless